MSVQTDRASVLRWTSFGAELVRRIAAESAALLRARRGGDELQIQISSAVLDDLYALAGRHDIDRATLP